MKIGISKGRIEEVFYKRLIERKIMGEYDKNTRKLEQDIGMYKLYSLKSIDILNLLIDGYLDLGVVGSDVINEKESENLVDLFDLESGKCSFVLATTKEKLQSNITIVATKYPNIASKLLESIGMNCEIRKMEGSLEIAPILDYADAIVDLVETGNTLKANGLIEVKRFDTISTRVVAKNENENNPKIREFIRKIR